MPKLTVNDVEVEVEDGSTVLHACEAAGVEILAWRSRVDPAGLTLEAPLTVSLDPP